MKPTTKLTLICREVAIASIARASIMFAPLEAVARSRSPRARSSRCATLGCRPKRASARRPLHRRAPRCARKVERKLKRAFDDADADQTGALTRQQRKPRVSDSLRGTSMRSIVNDAERSASTMSGVT
jgi:hypothetical protein